ncbi:MAG: hypothetical protein PHI58_07165 [Candidatus Omnitrophica bacterium]|nr:hypothetical protein [Candidatus Omnitrophota bacterium]
MIELIRNCSHGSEIGTYLVREGALPGRVMKAASTPEGIKNLRREAAGWAWYRKARDGQDGGPACRITKDKNNYLRLEIDFIDGMKADYAAGLEKNAAVIKKMLEHYCDVFPYYADRSSPFHGDFSVDNAIFGPDGIHIIDWEHFDPAGAPWGFDALYLLFETLYFGMRRRAKPSRKEADIISENINFLDAGGRLGRQAKEHPLKFVRSFIAGNPGLWSEQLTAFPGKLPVLAFTDEQTALIDDIVSSGQGNRKI